MKNNWQIKKLGEVCDIVNGFTPLRSNKEFWENGKIPWFTIDDIREQGRIIKSTRQKITKQSLGKTNARLLPSESVLLCCTASVGEYALTKIPLSTNQQFNGLVIQDKKILDPLFLYYFSATLKEELFKLSRKTTIDFIPVSRFREVKISYPSLSEQKRIVKFLDELFEKIERAKENTEKNLQNSQEFFESYLQNVFTNRGKGWVEIQLKDLLERQWIISHLDGNHGGEYPRKEEFKKEGVPYISAKCLRDDKVDLLLAKFLSPKRAVSIRKGIAMNNDVLFAHNATVGPVAILKTNETKIILGTSLTYYRCNPEYIFPEYLAHYMRSDNFKRQYQSVMRQSTRNQVPITIQREFLHIIPPLKEQTFLIKKFDELSEQTKKLEEIYKQKLANLEELKKSILQKAFSGEL